MSGPVQPPDEACRNDALGGVEVREGRRARVGKGHVLRVLPTKGRRTVGAWCFTDLAEPADTPVEADPMEVGPHPHIGLSTVTWLLEGDAVHTDSLGSEQRIRPGELNLMTAGHGIAHAELSTTPGFRGVQMWVAQPEATRHGPPAFEHHADLPRTTVGEVEALVFMGSLGDATSPARMDTPLVGAQLDLRPGADGEVPVDVGHEHAVIPLDRPVRVGREVVEVGSLALVPQGVDVLRLAVREQPGRALVLGGEPLGETVKMWWNFVARTTDELTQAWRDWQAHDEARFAPVASTLARIDAPRPPWLTQG